MNDEKEKVNSFNNSSLPSRIWKIGAMTTGVSADIIGSKIKEKIYPSKNQENVTINPETIEKIVKTLGELKGPWMKIGQYISLNDVYIDDNFLEAFSSLQYEAPSMSYYFTKMQINKELGNNPENLFKTFGRKPIGTASIGQVHEAYLKTGEKVAVKVQYPDMDKIISNDMMALKLGLTPLKVFFKNRIEPLMDELNVTLFEELDYIKEANNLEEFGEYNKEDNNIVIPKIYKELSSSRVLTMEFLEGTSLEKAIKENNPSQEIRNYFGRLLLKFLCTQLFYHHKIHADPHPGNFLYIDEERLGILDFGCVKSFSDEFINTYKKLIKDLIHKNQKEVREGFVKLGFAEEHETEKLDSLEEFSMFLAIPYFDKKYFDLDQNLDKLKEGRVELKKTAHKMGFKVPKEFLYLNRTLFGIGMILFKLRVNLNFYDEILPYLD